MHSLKIDSEFSKRLPHFSLAVMQAQVSNKPYDVLFQQEFDRRKGAFVLSHKLDEIKSIPAIYYTRLAYKTLGKDPNRYRPAAEQLCRRLVKGMGLYSINVLVDLGNMVSMETGFSIGVLDADKVNGEVLLRSGQASDELEGIGRGILNVEGLPLYLDETGAIASPTSDSERTKISVQTKNVLIFINNYIPQEEEGSALLEEAVHNMSDALTRFVNAKEITVAYYHAGNSH